MKSILLVLTCSLLGGPLFAAQPPAPISPLGKNGQTLNLDFERGSLQDWTATGNAFEKQPIRGDTVAPRRGDMKSAHTGNYWIGTFETGGDDLQGTLTSSAFKVTQPYAAFLMAGGPHANTRVELVRADSKKVFFKVSGNESETLRPVVVDLREQQGQEIFIRIVDEQGGHWGHVNFDDFKFYNARPQLANEYNPAKEKTSVIPPADSVLFAGLSAQEAAKAITLPKGFSAKLFAGEPDVMQPIAFAIDDRGRLWVAEAYTYPKRAPEGQGRDRILIFEDTDGDGTFDKRKVFIEGLNLVSGMEVGFGGVWVGAAPYLQFIADRNGDDVPDSAPQILLDGWAFQDTHETLNTFTWGPDGWLYGCQGVFTHSNVGKPGATDGERTRINAGIWRYHPVKHTFEVFAEGTSNPWGVDFDERGQCFIEACVIPHLFHMIQGARYQRQAGQHFNPYIFDDIKTIADHFHYAGDKGPHAGNGRSDSMGGGHAHAGLMSYQGGSWPAEYQNKLFMNNIHGQRINMDIPERAGSGFVGHHGADFLNFNDRWSQVINLQSDQDGSVYMIDWYDKNQCHHNDVNGHDRSNGRIFKVVYNNQPHTQVDLQKKSDAELVQLQLHKNDWYVRHARRLLQERAQAGKLQSSTAQALIDLVLSQKEDTRQLRALWTLHAIGGLNEGVVLQFLGNSSEYVRAWTIQLALENKNASTKTVALLARMAAAETSPVVRLYLASSLQRLPLEQRWDLAQSLIAHGEDAKDVNLPLVIWYGMEPLATVDANRALALAAQSRLPLHLNFMTRRVAALATPEAVASISQTLTTLTDATAQKAVLDGLQTAFKGQRSIDYARGWNAVETKFASTDAALRRQVQALSLLFGSPTALAELRQVIQDSKASATVRKDALQALVGAKDKELAPILQRLLKEPTLRSAALRGLATYDHAGTPDAILALYPSLDAAEKRDALATLLSRVTYAKPLLAAVAANQVPPRDLTADLVRQLRNLKNTEINTQVESVWGVVRESAEEKQKEIAKYKTIATGLTTRAADPAHGRALFGRTCAQCHTLFEVGGKVGPDLTGSNRADLDYILQNIIDPNAVIPNDYRTSTLDLKDDRVITGIVKAQDAKTITVVTANETLVLPRNEVKAQQQGELSMMPEGLITSLTDDEVRDLLAYLKSPAQVAEKK